MDVLPPELRARILTFLIPNNGTFVQDDATLGQDDGTFAQDDGYRWEYYLVSNSVRIHDGVHPQSKPTASLEIMRTSKALMNDCVRLLYGSNALFCTNSENAMQFLDLVGEQNASRITKFAFGPMGPHDASIPLIPALEVVVGILKRLPSLDELVLSGVGRGIPGVAPQRDDNLPYVIVTMDFDDILDAHRELVEGIVRTPGRMYGGTVFCTRHWRSTTVCEPGYSYVPSVHQSVMVIE